MSKDGISALERGYRRTPQRETLALLVGALALNKEERLAFDLAAARQEPMRRQLQTSVTIGPWPGAGPSILPLALTSFVGREVERDEIVALVRGYRLVTVTGPGGVGKTRMALLVGTMMSKEAESAICFVELASLSEPSLVVTAIASALSLQEVTNHPLLDTLQAYLRNKPLLLILDNCEHVIAEARNVAEVLLVNCPRVRILATSRELLRVAGERAYRLPSLTEDEAVELFVDRAQAVDHRFKLTDESAPIVAEICRRLDGIPLAIELAAARVNALTLRSLANRIDDRFRILAGNVARRRHQTMRATIDWSYDLLSPKEQRVLERLSVFAGGCALVAAEAVCASEGVSEGDVLDILSSLVDKSLLIAGTEGSEPRYRLLESFREYASEKLAMRGELDDALNRHALLFLELAEQLQLAFDSGPDDVWCTLLREELNNWRAALHWALIERGDVLLGQRLVGQLNVAWRTFARVEGRRWITLAFELVDDRTPRSVRASLSYCDATVSWHRREYQRSLTRCEDAIAHYKAVADSLGVAHAQDVASVALFFLGRVAESRVMAEEVLSVSRKAGRQVWAAVDMAWLGFIIAHEGNVAQARSYIADALQIFDPLGAVFEGADALVSLADVEFCAGNTELAFRYATDALARRSAFDPSSTLDHRSDLMRYLIALARYDEGGKQAREMLTIARERHEDVYAAFALQYLAAIAALRPPVVAEGGAEIRSRAAQILGFSDARIAATGSIRQGADQLVYDRAMSALRNAMGADTLSNLMAKGATMTEEQAVEAALACRVDAPLGG
jgi:predicted ATPase